MQVTKINNLSTNSYKQQYINKQHKPNNQQITAPVSNNAESLSFEGARFNKYGKLFLNSRDLDNEYYFFNDIYHFLSISKEALKPYFRLDRKDRTDFFYDLAENLSKDCFKQNKRLEPQESLKVLDNIYQIVKNPNRTHETIVKHPDFTFAQKRQLLFLTAEAGPKSELYNKLRHTQDIGKSVNTIDWSGEEYLRLLTSPNAGKLNTDFQTFKDYIRLNHDKPNFIEDLNRELAQEKPSFNPRYLLRQAIIADYSTSAPILRAMPQDELIRNWNPEGMELFDSKFTHSFHISYKDDQMNEENVNFYRYIFNTTTKDNLELRKKFFENTYVKAKNQDTNSTIINFLERLEADENLQTLYKTSNKRESRLTYRSFNELLFYADSFGSDVLVKKLDKFFDIIDTTSATPDEMVQILRKNLNNPYYLSEKSLSILRDNEIDIRNSNLFFPETKAQIFRLKRKFAFNFLPKIFGTGKETPVKMETSYQAYSDTIANAPMKGFIVRTDERLNNDNIIIIPSEVAEPQYALPALPSPLEKLENTLEEVVEAAPVTTEKAPAPAAEPMQLLSLSEILKRNTASPIFDMSKVKLAPVKKPTRSAITDPARLLMAPAQAEEKAKPSQILEILNTLETSAKAKEAAKPVIKRDYKAEYRARKLRIQKEAQEIIKTRMKSAKQIEEQIGIYTKNATKMRNQFLNEMFNSVAETRAQQRAMGIKHPKISNQDVIDTYLKINGKNKKIFKEMLKARTETGERKYSLKEIAQVLEAENKKNLEIKRANAARRKEERARLKALSLNNIQ